jgi:hypothetical protein
MSSYRHGSIVAGVLCGTLTLSVANAAQQLQGGGTSPGC